MKNCLIIITALALGLLAGCSGEGQTDIAAPAGSENSGTAAAGAGTSGGLAETPKPGESVGVPEGEK